MADTSPSALARILEGVLTSFRKDFRNPLDPIRRASCFLLGKGATR